MKKIWTLVTIISIVGVGYSWMYCSPAKTIENQSIKNVFDDTVRLEDNVLLKEINPQTIGIDPQDFDEISRIALNGITQKAYPGCQILIAIDGNIVYRKSFGKMSYDSPEAVRNDHLYDIASVTKIASSTLAIMRLQTLNKFSLQKQLKDYIPEVVGNNEFGSILLKDMMTHQAGLVAWIPFYKKTLENNQFSEKYYSTAKKQGFEIQVAKNVWLRNDYADTIYQRIMNSGLTPGHTYLYSDLGYYFIKKIVEKQAFKPLNLFVKDEIYDVLNLKNIGYLPLTFSPLERIIPTEDDKAFRQQLLQGFVHDPGAAMLGGVGGHAGLFANSTDLASIMQLFLNKGKAGDKQLIDSAVVNEYTRVQFAHNRRGAGFDKPTLSRKNGPCCDEASSESFGHSGFTGTFAWADPKHKINYVFLSNRVCPSADNKKLVNMGIRTQIQSQIYKILLKVRPTKQK
jgi:beta-N-acetylhexosaminidase